MDRYGIILGKKPPSLPEPVVVGAPMAFPPDSSSHTVDDFLTEFFFSKSPYSSYGPYDSDPYSSSKRRSFT